MPTVRLEIDDMQPGMRLSIKLDNEEYVYELDDDGEPDEDPGEAGAEEPASLDARRFKFGGSRA